MIEEPLPVFEDWGEEATLTKADASSTLTTLALYDETEVELADENGSMDSRQPIISTPAAGAGAFGEGDRIALGTRRFTILDALRDDAVAVFTVAEDDLTAENFLAYSELPLTLGGVKITIGAAA